MAYPGYAKYLKTIWDFPILGFPESILKLIRKVLIFWQFQKYIYFFPFFCSESELHIHFSNLDFHFQFPFFRSFFLFFKKFHYFHFLQWFFDNFLFLFEFFLFVLFFYNKFVNFNYFSNIFSKLCLRKIIWSILEFILQIAWKFCGKI